MAEGIMRPVLVREKTAQWINGRHGYLNSYRCHCGNEFVAQPNDVRNGKHGSCGCKKLCKASHGMTGHPLYYVHKSMMARCLNQNCADYAIYGGRGITVCEEWQADRTAFFAWAFANGWAKGLLIDRIDVNGNYEPSNCRFVTIAESNRNKRSESYRGKLSPEDVAEIRRLRETGMSIKSIAKNFGVAFYTIWKTVNHINHITE